MERPHYHSKVKKLLGDDFTDLLSEISPFIGPRFDVYITNEKFFVSAEIAGIESDDYSVKLLGNILIIEGTIKQKYPKKTNILINERFYGSFKREIIIPESCMLDGLQAEFEKGILLISIPFIE